MAGFNNQGFSSPKLHQSSSSNSIKASSKVIYKRRRASRRVPTTILETSCQEFRDAVQKLTGFHRPTPSAASPKQPLKARASMAPMPSSSYGVDDEHLHHAHHDYEDDAAQVAAQGQSSSSPQSALSDPSSVELPHGEFIHHFLRESAAGGGSSPRNYDAAVPTSRGGSPFAAFANMPAQLRAAHRQPAVGPNAALFGAAAGARGAMPPFWEDAFGRADFMASLAKLQDPGMAPNPYLIALENQLLAKFARRMQLAASNPLDHPWYQMDHMAPLRA